MTCCSPVWSGVEWPVRLLIPVPCPIPETPVEPACRWYVAQVFVVFALMSLRASLILVACCASPSGPPAPSVSALDVTPVPPNLIVCTIVKMLTLMMPRLASERGGRYQGLLVPQPTDQLRSSPAGRLFCVVCAACAPRPVPRLHGPAITSLTITSLTMARARARARGARTNAKYQVRISMRVSTVIHSVSVKYLQIETSKTRRRKGRPRAAVQVGNLLPLPVRWGGEAALFGGKSCTRSLSPRDLMRNLSAIGT
jgi:hypothetical protein